MNFPKQNLSQHKGRKGETRFADFVVNTLNCIYHKIDGSDDYGIDGHIEIVANNAVTGRFVAVQVKHGNSYFTHKTKNGYKFTAKDKYLNYYLNSPVPVFIIIMDDDFSRMLWVQFDLAQILPSGSDSWWIEIPKSNELTTNLANGVFTSVGAIFDYSKLISSIKHINNELNKASLIIIGISRDEINTLDFSGIMSTFEALSRNKMFQSKFMSACSLCFPEYDTDTREIVEIPEVMQWLRESIKCRVPWFYFLDITKESGMYLLMCSYTNPTLQLQEDGSIYVESDTEKAVEFIEHAFDNLNTFTEFYNIDIETNKNISEKLGKFFFKDEGKSR